MVDTEVVAGLAVGYFGGQFLGNFIESKIKPDIIDTATSQDKMIAGVANDGSKAVLAYGAYKYGTTSPFLKNIAWGATLAAVIDAGWRYSHNGVPYGYKPFNIPLLGDLNEIIAGPNSGSRSANSQEPLALPAPPMSPAKKQAICSSIKTDAITKNRSYTAQEMELCTGLLNLQDYTTPVPGTSPGDITSSPTIDPSAPVQDEDPVSTIPDRKSRFAFMEDKTARHFGFALGSPTSGREKYFGMKT
jgi:hypothetical protein